MKEKIKIFSKYVLNFDFNEENIKRKYYHSIRVMDLSRMIAKSIDFQPNDLNIASLVGLLHDYARFPQWTKYHTFNDLDSIDHGDLAVDILFHQHQINQYTSQIANYDEIYDAIKYHNKYEIPTQLSTHNKQLCQVIRDADKLDILYLISIKEIKIMESNDPVSINVKNGFLNEKSINCKNRKNHSDQIVSFIAFVFDLNYDYSFKYLEQYKLLDKIYNNIYYKDQYKFYFDYAKQYVKERLVK